MLTSSQLKENAKARLKGNWGGALGTQIVTDLIIMSITAIVLFFGGISAIIETIVRYSNMYGSSLSDQQAIELGFYLLGAFLRILIILGLVSLFISSPIRYGLSKWYHNLARGKKPAISDIFYFFTSGQRYKTAIFLTFNLGIREYGWRVLVNLPISILTSILTYGNRNSSGAALFAQLLSAAGTFLLVYILLRYFITMFQLLDYEQLTTTEAINRSINGMKEFRGSIFKLQLSFILWYILLAVIISVPILMVVFSGISSSYMGRGMSASYMWLLLILLAIPLAYYLTIYYNATMFEAARNISDMKYGDPANSNAYDQFGNPIVTQPNAYGSSFTQVNTPPMGQPQQPYYGASQQPVVPQQPMQQQPPIVQQPPVQQPIVPPVTAQDIQPPTMDYNPPAQPPQPEIYNEPAPEAPQPPTADSDNQ